MALLCRRHAWSADAVIRRGVTVSGRVQGVYFRQSTARRAAELGVTGWVRNRADGSVELEAQADGDAVEALLGWVRSGPPSAIVTHLEIVELPVESGETGFRIRR